MWAGIFLCYLFGFWCQGLKPKVSEQEGGEAALSAYDERGCFPSDKQSISVELINSWGFPEC